MDKQDFSITKRLFKKSITRVFYTKINVREGLLIGAWIGLFTGFLWVIGSRAFSLPRLEQGGSIFSPFILWLFISKNIRTLGDFADIFFLVSSSAMAGLTSVIGSYLLDYNNSISFTQILSGMGIGLLVGGINIWALVDRGT
jgi:hypothetical protein